MPTNHSQTCPSVSCRFHSTRPHKKEIRQYERPISATTMPTGMATLGRIQAIFINMDHLGEGRPGRASRIVKRCRTHYRSGSTMQVNYGTMVAVFFSIVC